MCSRRRSSTRKSTSTLHRLGIFTFLVGAFLLHHPLECLLYADLCRWNIYIASTDLATRVEHRPSLGCSIQDSCCCLNSIVCLQGFTIIGPPLHYWYTFLSTISLTGIPGTTGLPAVLTCLRPNRLYSLVHGSSWSTSLCTTRAGTIVKLMLDQLLWAPVLPQRHRGHAVHARGALSCMKWPWMCYAIMGLCLLGVLLADSLGRTVSF